MQFILSDGDAGQEAACRYAFYNDLARWTHTNEGVALVRQCESLCAIFGRPANDTADSVMLAQVVHAGAIICSYDGSRAGSSGGTGNTEGAACPDWFLPQWARAAARSAFGGATLLEAATRDLAHDVCEVVRACDARRNDVVKMSASDAMAQWWRLQLKLNYKWSGIVRGRSLPGILIGEFMKRAFYRCWCVEGSSTCKATVPARGAVLTGSDSTHACPPMLPSTPATCCSL